MLLPFPIRDRQPSRWPTAVITGLAVLPLLLATTALNPALLLCPFLSERHRRFLLSLLAVLSRWSRAIMLPCDEGSRSRG